jgi:hypothetical protein
MGWSKGRTGNGGTATTSASLPDAIAEPVTVFTDYVLGSAALLGGLRLAKKGRAPGHVATALWAAGFFSLSAGAFLGGTWHGFSPRLPPMAGAVLWKGTLAAAGGASFFLLAGAAFASLHGRKARWLTGFAAVKLAAFLAWAAFHDGFEGVVVDSTVSMAAILALQAAAWRRRRDPAAPWVLSGILLSAAGAAIEAAGIRPGDLVSHDDLYHVVQTGAVYLLYRGGCLFDQSRP